MKLKICGMKENPQEVADLAPDYLGFIFWKPSTRFISQPPAGLTDDIKRVGVFVDASIPYILAQVGQFKLSLVQLHGEESPEFCLALRKELSTAFGNNTQKIELIKVFSVNDEFEFSGIVPYEEVCDYFLFDTKGKLPGGNGYAFNWELLRAYPLKKPYFLSGGIGLGEVPQLIRFMRSPEARYCHALDVNSKFETAPGVKDIPGLKQFIKLIFDK
ncbi:phosphoribosylanthranilate isomerase [Lentiprolixibacter aurantiacus]|uniref:N-(5'-phosphoribosyl)anthranilate isomerase n=1 Tax=Lentiprolixibacter aurantiacus TaxID=2993939 RepID=A0AAE3SNB3_9FLAO|nr:phosphoribosylanthranilate isomerase [Lentiprolixibacter aurantiacus]MCX2719310.1 phosphoribosylanthranilate isomerase [Lentiprolixibacter aurantiacus]